MFDKDKAQAPPLLAQDIGDEEAYLLEEAEGLAQLDRGECVDFDEVLAKADAIVAAAEARRNAPPG